MKKKKIRRAASYTASCFYYELPSFETLFSFLLCLLLYFYLLAFPIPFAFFNTTPALLSPRYPDLYLFIPVLFIDYISSQCSISCH